MNDMDRTGSRPSCASSIIAELVDGLTAKVQAGEAIDWDEMARQHPEHVSELRRLWPALGALNDLSQSGVENLWGLATPGVLEEELVKGVLGDFRLLREVGRGGMGIVYEAAQISLRRRVALKVLPFAATMDPRHLQRFQNEAQAAACLHHTNIVPVFSVGCERGVHFYAMQFIEGQPLSDLIRQLCGREKTASMPVGEARMEVYQPAPSDAPATMPSAAEMTPLTAEGKRGRDYYRKVAELGVQAAEALDHAHQLGIVHRDIKPANLLLDGRGNLWVTDFGLAHMQHGEANLTVTGQALGTPRYMSPEQALAQRVPIDHRTDVYSLGATLYELLTLRPAFWTEDRQELMRQIAFEEPTPLRRLERTIPAELEIIVLKAMEKRPQDRYATAQELADDLERWLRNEPIRARRPTLVQRAGKWQRRHRAAVLAAVLGLFLAVIVLATSTFLIAGAYREEAHQRGLAEKAEGRENEQRRKAERERELSESALFVAQTRLAQTYQERGRFTQLKGLLAEQVPLPGKPDRRGWEWHYLQSVCSRDLLTVGGKRDGKYDSVTACALSPQGQFLATAHVISAHRTPSFLPGSDVRVTIEIWDIATRQTIHTLSGFSRTVWFLGYSPDGRHLASAGWEEPIRVWSATTGKEVTVIRGHAGSISAIRWSPDGRRLASAGADKTVRVWDAGTGRELAELTGHTAPVQSAAWSPDGRRLASSSQDKTVRVWDAATGRGVCTIDSGEVSISSVMWSPNGQRLVASDYNNFLVRKDVPVWDATTGKEVLVLRTSAGGCAVWSPDGKWLATDQRGTGGEIRVWDAAKGTEAFPLASPVGHAIRPAWSPDGGRLLAVGEYGVVVWDIHSRVILFHVPTDSIFVDWGPGGDRLLCKSFDRPTSTWRTQVLGGTTGQDSILLRGHTGSVNGVAWCKDGKRLASASSDGTAKVWDATTGEDLLTLRQCTEWGVGAVAWSPDGRNIATGEGPAEAVPIRGSPHVMHAATNPRQARIRFWDVATGREVRNLPTDSGNITTLAYSPDGKWLASIQDAGLLKVRDISTGAENLSLGRCTSLGIAFSADSRLLAYVRVSQDGNEIVVCEVTTGREVFCYNESPRGEAVALSPDGRLLAGSFAETGAVRIWDLTTGQELPGLTHPEVLYLAFTPDGKRLATATRREIKLWEVTTGNELLTLPLGSADEFQRILQFSPVGHRLVTWGPNDTIRVWDAETRPSCLFSETRHPRHRQYLRNEHWVRGSSLARDYHTQVAWYGSDGKGDPRGAERAYRRAMELQQGLVKEAPLAPDRRHELALLHLELGDLLLDNRRAEETGQSYDAATELLRALAREFPDVLVYQRDLRRASGINP